MQLITIKQEAYRLIDGLEDDENWDDLMYKIYVRQTIEQGLQESEAGKVRDVREIRRKFGLMEIVGRTKRSVSACP